MEDQLRQKEERHSRTTSTLSTQLTRLLDAATRLSKTEFSEVITEEEYVEIMSECGSETGQMLKNIQRVIQDLLAKLQQQTKMVAELEDMNGVLQAQLRELRSQRENGYFYVSLCPCLLVLTRACAS